VPAYVGERSKSAPARHLRGARQGLVHGEDTSAGRRRPHRQIQEGPAASYEADRGTNRDN